MKNKNKIDGYNERHLAQLIRRKMITRLKPNKKKYSRKEPKDNLAPEKQFIIIYYKLINKI